ncbi:ATP-dependent DNA helicase [Sedimentibacter sp. MB31-C6]|uniref:ATP-dependent DNA helicase n=1 Tax=Sedimentibacter sp. MB31-C6 TaxID=3109366 RepID=UPI002DDD3ABB|nr:ATP-dependent DNA helicase [Sedimentibacter sp. MB36-C1]WSI04302.1 ATP-dependent DNA helicase [Sedimentibacter sp. MB36-C1]
MDNIKLSVRELVEFIYKSGDLNTSSISNERAMEGIKAHKLLQSQMSENYIREFFLKQEFEIDNVYIVIEGRADGIVDEDDKVTIDEIKSTYTDLEKINENYNKSHIAQAKCYAYIYGLQNKVDNLNIQLRYFNIDSKKTKELYFSYDIDELRAFFYEMLHIYVDWAKTIISLNKSKAASIDKLKFPFESYRQGQREFSVAVFKTIKLGQNLFAQAPTGVGKTISVLFPAIKAMNLKKNSKIFYLTAKSSTKTIAFDTIKLMVDNGLKLRTSIITAKEKICFKEECNCEPEICEYARGYYDKLNAPLKNAIKNDLLYDRVYIENLAKKNEICPFELSLDLSYMSDIVICDYNYYFDPRVALQRDDVFKKSNDILLIDEAHNLEDRARNMYSPEIVKEDFYNTYKIMKEINKNISKDLYNVNKKFIELKKSMIEVSEVLEEEPKDLIKSIRKFVDSAGKYINNKKVNHIPDELVDIYFKGMFFIKISEMYDDNFCYYMDLSKNNFTVKIYLIDPSDILNQVEKQACSSIFFSATLTPLKYFRYILGGEESDLLLKIKSPFKEKHLNLMITGDISMKYSCRDLNIEKACEYIHATINEKMGNYMIFFPSYNYLEKVVKVYENCYNTNNIIVQNKGMNEEEQIEIINRFNNYSNIVLFTVVGGIFSEGIDLPLERLIGTVIIGTGIPQISFERNLIKNFFDRKYNSGFDFAYKFPGFNKILQSAGRVIRTEEDKGVVVLIDSRFCQYSYINMFPGHWKHYKEIYNVDELKKQINNFWFEKEDD